MDYTLNIVSKCFFSLIFKHLWAPNRSWKVIRGGSGTSRKSLGIFVSKRVGTLLYTDFLSHGFVLCEHLASTILLSDYCHVVQLYGRCLITCAFLASSKKKVIVQMMPPLHWCSMTTP